MASHNQNIFFTLLFILTSFQFLLSCHYLLIMMLEQHHQEAVAVVVAYYSRKRRLEQDRQPRKKPRFWMSRQSITPAWYETVLLQSGNSVWIEHFRFPEASINNLCDLLKDDLAPSDITVREPVPLKKRICIALYKLAGCSEYRTVAAIFGVSKTSVHRYVYAFVTALSMKKKQFIRWYTDDEARQIAEENETRYKYPQAIGSVDGSHIPVNAPLDGKSDYLCRKMYPSVVLQAVVDCYYKFRDIYANTPGSAHDAAVYQRSPLSTLVHTSMPQHDRVINGVTIPLHILGDPAYPHSEKIMKGYVGLNLAPKGDSFNVYLSSTRMCVEIGFGRLKSRWRILQKRMDLDCISAPRIITACTILHNLCEDLKLPTPPPNANDEMNAAAYPQPAREINRRVENGHAKIMRDCIRDFLHDTQPLRKSFHK